MTRQIKFAEGEYYHIYSRGVDKRPIFLCNQDKDRFVKLLYLCNGEEALDVRDLPKEDVLAEDRGESLVDIGAYCLMSNHFHLLLHEKSEGGITAFMLRLLTSYSMYFNKKYKRTGRLFESSFKAKHLETDEALEYLYSYIHLNPVKAVDSDWRREGIKDMEATKDFLSRYLYSSYLDYADMAETLRPEAKILNKKAFPEYFSEPKEFTGFIDLWLKYSEEEPQEENPSA